VIFRFCHAGKTCPLVLGPVLNSPLQVTASQGTNSSLDAAFVAARQAYRLRTNQIGFVLKLVIGVRLPFHFGRYFNHSPNCFSTRRKVDLTAPPVVYGAQKVL
jgi:hypothetical protein